MCFVEYLAIRWCTSTPIRWLPSRLVQEPDGDGSGASSCKRTPETARRDTMDEAMERIRSHQDTLDCHIGSIGGRKKEVSA